MPDSMPFRVHVSKQLCATSPKAQMVFTFTFRLNFTHPHGRSSGAGTGSHADKPEELSVEMKTLPEWSSSLVIPEVVGVAVHVENNSQRNRSDGEVSSADKGRGECSKQSKSHKGAGVRELGVERIIEKLLSHTSLSKRQLKNSERKRESPPSGARWRV